MLSSDFIPGNFLYPLLGPAFINCVSKKISLIYKNRRQARIENENLHITKGNHTNRLPNPQSYTGRNTTI